MNCVQLPHYGLATHSSSVHCSGNGHQNFVFMAWHAYLSRYHRHPSMPVVTRYVLACSRFECPCRRHLREHLWRPACWLQLPTLDDHHFSHSQWSRPMTKVNYKRYFSFSGRRGVLTNASLESHVDSWLLSVNLH
jgi:hypothetical protein